MTQPIRYELSAGVAILTIDREDRMNALSRDTVLAFGELGRQIEKDSQVRVVVVTGAGNRAFCAGADLKERKTMTEDDTRAMLRLYRSELGWLAHSPVPTVAVLNGAALGGGLELALHCDLRIAAEHAMLGLPETGLGIIPGAGGTQRLPRLVGEARAKEFILRGARLTASEAHQLGLVNRITPAGVAVLEDALQWLEPIVQGAPLAQRAALRATRAALNLPLDQGLELELACYEVCLKSADRKEALLAFAEKRKPAFQGR